MIYVLCQKFCFKKIVYKLMDHSVLFTILPYGNK